MRESVCYRQRSIFPFFLVFSFFLFPFPFFFSPCQLIDENWPWQEESSCSNGWMIILCTPTSMYSTAQGRGRGEEGRYEYSSRESLCAGCREGAQLHDVVRSLGSQ